ncbi:hypothetical protein [Actinomadura harenae]|uniref:Uncharacterized protein n=1 Tax=Actinomadura harenae TaxID=2483351 RepID=A0A3M2M6C7_9ACTN|nr:hypothetical protein [Actinomadura harenae]RMI44065.1 hypothetical protein EBO15_14185 [Actinomadura harenae]
MPIQPRRGADRDAPPTRAETKSHTDDQRLADLREEFRGHRIWRSPRWDGGLGCWIATLHDPMQGVDPTVIRDTADQLRNALLEERELAERRGDRR